MIPILNRNCINQSGKLHFAMPQKVPSKRSTIVLAPARPKALARHVGFSKRTRKGNPVRAASASTANSSVAANVAAALSLTTSNNNEQLDETAQKQLTNDNNDSEESADSSDDGQDGLGLGLDDFEGDAPKQPKVVSWSFNQIVPHVSCPEFDLSNNCYDINNSGQGVDMQNLPSIAEQLERQRTWMTIYFRYRVNWYEAKPVLAKMSRDIAYRNSNLPLWTRCLKVQLNRKTIFLNAVRAFRNRMQCALSGIRFMLNSFYQDNQANRERDSDYNFRGPECKPLPYFRCPDDMPELKTMTEATLNVFVSTSTSFFDQFWDECLKNE